MPAITFTTVERYNRTLDVIWQPIESSSKYVINIISSSTLVTSFNTGIRNGFSYTHDSPGTITFAVDSRDKNDASLASSNKIIVFSNYTIVSSVGLIFTSGTLVYCSGSESTDSFVVQYNKDSLAHQITFTGSIGIINDDISIDSTVYAINSSTQNYSLPTSINLVDLRPQHTLTYKERLNYSGLFSAPQQPNFTTQTVDSGFIFLSFSTGYGYPIEIIDLTRSYEFTGKPVFIYQKSLDNGTVNYIGTTFEGFLGFSYIPNITGFLYQGYVPVIDYNTNILERYV